MRTREMPSEAAARTARERSEQEREAFEAVQEAA